MLMGFRGIGKFMGTKVLNSLAQQEGVAFLSWWVHMLTCAWLCAYADMQNLEV
jgi:hypothetical protein